MTAGGPRRSLLPLLLKIEDSAKPIVMAIHGQAFGGGLELAMAGHYRVASPSAQVVEPEVKLGIIPGAGGTQRLPRLVGIAKTVEMCAEGKPVSVRAPTFGLIDRLIDGDLLAGAVGFAREIAAKPAPKTRERTDKDKQGTAADTAAIFVAARDTARKKQRGLIAPLAAIDAVEASTKLPFDQAAKLRRNFSPMPALRSIEGAHPRFLRRARVHKIPDIPKETPVLAINRVAVVGSGTMAAASRWSLPTPASRFLA